MKKKFLVDQAADTVRQRQKQYAHPWKNFNDIAQCWSALFGFPITAEQVALAMIMLKCLRENNKPHDDNLVDIGGYTICKEQINTIRSKIDAGDPTWEDELHIFDDDNAG